MCTHTPHDRAVVILLREIMKLGKICTKGRKIGSGRQKLYVFSHTENMNLIYIKYKQESIPVHDNGRETIGKKGRRSEGGGQERVLGGDYDQIAFYTCIKCYNKFMIP